MEQSKRPADFSRNPGAAAEGGGVCRSGGHRNHVSAGKSDIAMGTSTQQLKQLTGCLAEWWWSLWNPQNCKAGVDVKIQGSERSKEKPGEYIRGEQGPPLGMALQAPGSGTLWWPPSWRWWASSGTPESSHQGNECFAFLSSLQPV